MTNFNDQFYIHKIKNGDYKAFEVLVNQYKNLVFSIALKMVKNKENAEEIAQDSFIKVYKKIDKFKGKSKFSTWLYKITYNTSLDYIKKNKKNDFTYSLDDLTLNKVIETGNALENLEIEENKQLIRQCLNKLKEEEQVLLTLYYFEELSLQEIATIINKSYNQVRINLHRSRKKLALILNNHLAPEIIQSYGR
jgi:RNA polymerase sigma-70 factor (ECF subfamily)